MESESSDQADVVIVKDDESSLGQTEESEESDGESLAETDSQNEEEGRSFDFESLIAI